MLQFPGFDGMWWDKCHSFSKQKGSSAECLWVLTGTTKEGDLHKRVLAVRTRNYAQTIAQTEIYPVQTRRCPSTVYCTVLSGENPNFRWNASWEPDYQSNCLKALLSGISLSEYGAEGFRVRLRRLSEYGSVTYQVERLTRETRAANRLGVWKCHTPSAGQNFWIHGCTIFIQSWAGVWQPHRASTVAPQHLHWIKIGLPSSPEIIELSSR